MEINECTYVPDPLQSLPPEAPKPEHKDKREHLKIRISMFFDGTGNNRTNTETREKRRPKYFEIVKSDTWQESSYFNDLSNVARLEKHVDTDTHPEYTHAFKVYTEGIGTLDNESDSTIGSGTGKGMWFTEDTGVMAKVAKGLAKAIKELTDLFKEPSKYVIDLLTVDTFGFSRGAAAARFCVYRVLHAMPKFMGQVGSVVTRAPDPSLKARLEGLGFAVEKIEVRAVGLYDTVSSLGIA